MTEPLKVGIAGYGVVGKRRRGVIDAHPSLEVAVVSDRTLGGDGVFDDGVRYFDDYEKLLDENKPIENGSSDDAFRTMQFVYRIYCADPDWKTKWGLSDDVPNF